MQIEGLRALYNIHRRVIVAERNRQWCSGVVEATVNALKLLHHHHHTQRHGIHILSHLVSLPAEAGKFMAVGGVDVTSRAMATFGGQLPLARDAVAVAAHVAASHQAVGVIAAAAEGQNSSLLSLCLEAASLFRGDAALQHNVVLLVTNVAAAPKYIQLLIG